MAQQQAFGTGTVEGIEELLTGMLAGDLAGATLHLYKQGFAPSQQSVAADFDAQEADFVGYAPVVLTWSAVGIDATGSPVALSDRAFFQATDATSPNIVGGAWISKDVVGPPAVSTSIQFWQFNPAVGMGTALASIGAVVAMQWPGNPGYLSVDY